MTGKEALNKIQHDFGNLKGGELTECFETISKDLDRLEKLEKIAKFKPEVLKRFKIELQPMRKKQNIHYSNHVIEYLNQNIRTWTNWGRLPITITDTTTNRQLTIHANEWIKWKEMVYEWLGIPKEVLEVI